MIEKDEKILWTGNRYFAACKNRRTAVFLYGKDKIDGSKSFDSCKGLIINDQ